MKYTWRIWSCIISILFTLAWLTYYYLKGTLSGTFSVTYYEIFIMILFLQPLFWWIGGLHDKLKYNSKKQELQQKEWNSIFENSDAFLWTQDDREKKVRVSKGIEEIFGFTSGEFEKDFNLWASRTYPEDQTKVLNYYQKLLSGSAAKCEWRFFRKNGELRWLEAFGNPIFDDNGQLVKLNGVAYDVTERKQMEEKLEKHAYYDSLTGLPNRRNFKESAQKAISCSDSTNQKLAIMFIDLDRFKFINDTMGHDTGDELLKEVGQRISQSIRDIDVVARLGGDEFIILLKNIEVCEVSEIARHILNTFSSPFILERGEVFTTPSIGISLYPKDGEDIATLTTRADDAMYLAKECGKNNFQFYFDAKEGITERKAKT